MKILFIASDTQALGGIQQYNRKFIKCLRDRGDKLSLVELRGSGIPARAWFVLVAALKGVFLAPDLTICAHVNYSPIGFFLGKALGRKYAVVTHGVDVWDVRKKLQRAGLLHAAVITTVAEFTRDKMVSQFPELKERIYLLYNPIDGARFVPKEISPVLADRYKLEGKKVIFTIARLSSLEGYKGYDRVIMAMPKILASVPDAVYLLGGKGDDAPRVKKLIADTGLSEKVRMAGFVSDEELVDHYNLADVFIMPSTTEGAPAVFIEALCCGIPVIAGNKDGSPTPLQGGLTGLLIDPESIDEIADAVIRVLKGDVEESLLDRKFLREKTLEKFGLDRFPQRVNEMLERI